MLTPIEKFDEEGQDYPCILAVSNKCVYDYVNNEMNSRVPADRVRAVTVSKMGNEFIMHVPDGVDCRYDHPDKEQIIEVLNKLHRGFYKGQPIMMFFRDDITLENYTALSPKVRQQLDPEIEHFNLYQDYFESKETSVSMKDFTLLKVLGKGSYGKVMLVKHRETGKLYALKSMKKVDIVENERLEHTKVEKMILKHLSHPFLVNLEFCFQTQEKIFFGMAFLRGGEIFQHLKNEKRFSESKAKFYAAQIALAIGHLHSYSIIYRDMKPENILMGDDGYISLADFGMAKIVNPNTPATSFCGTPEYIAPEIILGDGHGKEVDWWGLGILIYEMMYGIPPFYSTNHNLMYESIQKNDVHFPEQVSTSKEAKDFIRKCLLKDPKQRLGSVGDIEEIQAHPWFDDFDWGALLRKELPVPFRPSFQSAVSTEYFDEQFTQQEPVNSVGQNIDYDLIFQFDSEFQSVEYTD